MCVWKRGREGEKENFFTPFGFPSRQSLHRCSRWNSWNSSFHTRSFAAEFPFFVIYSLFLVWAFSFRFVTSFRFCCSFPLLFFLFSSIFFSFFRCCCCGFSSFYPRSWCKNLRKGIKEEINKKRFRTSPLGFQAQ